MARDLITDAEADKAKDVIRRHYNQWVDGMVADLVREYFTEHDGDIESFRDRIAEVVDSAMTYTSDQYDTIYASESSGDGLDMARDAGGEFTLGIWAYFTMESDIAESFNGNDLVTECESSGASDLDAKIEWLIENHGKMFIRRSGLFAYLIGTLNEGQRDELDLGVLTATKQPGDRGAKYNFISLKQARRDHEMAVALDALEEGHPEKFIDDEVEDPAED